MKMTFPRAAAVALVLALSACSTTERMLGLDETPEEGDLITPPDSDIGAEGAAGTVPPEAPEATDPGAEEILVKTPDGTEWRTDVTEQQEAEAIAEGCYNYAAGAAQSQARIESDMDAGRDTLSSLPRFEGVGNKVLRPRESATISELMADCMSGRGFSLALP